MFWRFIRFFVSQKSNEFYPFDKNKQRRYSQKKIWFSIINKNTKNARDTCVFAVFFEFLSKIIR